MDEDDSDPSFSEVSPVTSENSGAIVVPPANLSDHVLDQLAYERLWRERGNDGPGEEITDAMLSGVLSAIKKGSLLITFDPETESVGLIDAKEFQKLKATTSRNATLD